MFILYVLLGSGVLVGVGRYLVPGHDLSLPGTYEAFAHIWVGAVGMASYYDKKYRVFYLCLIGVLTTLETFKFLTR